MLRKDTLPRPSTDALGTVDEYLEGTLKYSQFLQIQWIHYQA